MVSTSPHGSFQPHWGPGLDLGNQKASIGCVSKSCVLNFSLDNFCKVTFLKSVYLEFSNKNTSLIFFVVLCCPALYPFLKIFLNCRRWTNVTVTMMHMPPLLFALPPRERYTS